MQPSSDASGLVWYTLLDPTTEQFFYACPATGACQWNPPTTGSILQGHLPDWWEMYDEGTNRPYYFNNTSQETLWVLPKDLNVIPVPLSSEDDVRLRNVLGPPPESDAPPDFVTEEVSEYDDVIDVSALPDSPKGGLSPRKLVESEATTAEWVALEDPRTGYSYFMNRKTLKLAWNHSEMLHQQIASYEKTAKPEDVKPKQVVEAPKPQGYVVRHDSDPDFTSDTWKAPTEPVPELPKQPLPLVASSSNANNANKAVNNNKQNNANNKAINNNNSINNKPKQAAPIAPHPAAAKQPQVPQPRKESQSQKELEAILGAQLAIPAAPAYLPTRQHYRASIMQRPLPSPVAPGGGPKKAPPSSYSAMALGQQYNAQQRPTPGTKSNSVMNLTPSSAKIPVVNQPPPAPNAKQSPGSNQLSLMDSKPRVDSNPPANKNQLGSGNEPKRGRSRSFDQLEAGDETMTTAQKQAQAATTSPPGSFKRPAGKLPPAPPAVPKTSTPPAALPPIPPMPARILNSASSPKLETAPAVPKFPLPSEAGHRSAPRPTPQGGAPNRESPNSKAPNSQRKLTPPYASAAPTLLSVPNPTSSPASPPGSIKRAITKPFNGPPPPVPVFSIPGSAKLPYPGGPVSPTGKSVIVTMDNRGRAGSKNRISFRASISRVAPPNMAELNQEAIIHGLSPMMMSPPSTKMPFMRSLTANPHHAGLNQPAAAPPMHAAVPTPPLGYLPLGRPPMMAVSNSASNIPSSSAPRSMPAREMGAEGVVSGSATTSRASTRSTRPPLQKSYTMNAGRPEGSPGAPTISGDLKAQINFFQLEGFATQYFKNMKRGLFRRAVPVRQRLTWSQVGLKQPLLRLKGEPAKKSLVIFKHIQTFMGDRALTSSQEEKLKLVEAIFELGLNTAQLRDEIFCQLCKQTTLNPNADSTIKGWSLITTFLQYFSPTKDLEHWFMDYCREHEKSQNQQLVPFVKYALRILSRPAQSGVTMRVPEPDEIELALQAPLQPRLFGVTLTTALENQQKHKIPTLSEPGMPYILTNLISVVTRLGGPKTEGIFRIPGSHKLCTKLRLQLEAGIYTGDGILDPHVPASVLKWWLRDLEEPVIPPLFYPSCLDAAKSPHPETACPAVIDRLPALNKSVVYSIIKFVQVLARPENQAETKMAVGSLAIVFGPNLLRCQATEMSLVFEAQKWEQTFVVNLVKHLST